MSRLDAKIAQPGPMEAIESPTTVLSILGGFVELTKPRLTTLAVMATLAGYYLGSEGLAPLGTLFSALIGAYLLGGGANALNQCIEREFDARMRRTANRPIPTGRLGLDEAMCFGTVAACSGVAFLALTVNLLTGLLALLTLITYVFLYTPLKRISPLSTLAGAIPGALPILMGWAAAGRGLSAVAWSLFAIVFVWQIPHFFAICWYHREDYARAAYPMLPVADLTGRWTGIVTVATSVLLAGVSSLPTILGASGVVYLIGAAALGLMFTAMAVAMAVTLSKAAARLTFLASIVYLAGLMALLVVDSAG